MASKPGFWTSLHGMATLILTGVALYFIFVDHSAHILPYIPFLIILWGPLMHIFMHKGHGDHGENSKGEHQHQDAEEAYRRGLEEGRKKRMIDNSFLIARAIYLSAGTVDI